MVTFTDATHNMLFTMTPADWRADLAKSAKGDIVGYQEAEEDDARKTLQDFCTAKNRGLHHPIGSGNAVSWNRAMFRAIRGERGVIEVHKKHPTAKYNPGRDIVYVGLRCLPANKNVLRINIHPVAGATLPHSETEWGDDLDAWKNWAIANYYLDLLSFVATQMSREYWDVILLGGDYNASLTNKDAWYYPGRMLPSLFVDDTRLAGLDHLQHTHGSDVKPGKRWTEEANTDHLLHFLTRTIVNVVNYPEVR
jgi:hypothetical protein